MSTNPNQIKDPIVLRELSYEVMGAVYEVHNTLGPGFLEKVYENALVRELQDRNITVEVQREIKVIYKGEAVGFYCADLLINGEVILELKAVNKLSPIHEAQVLNYLKATGVRLGLLINFGKERVEYKRLVL